MNMKIPSDFVEGIFVEYHDTRTKNDYIDKLIWEQGKALTFNKK